MTTWWTFWPIVLAGGVIVIATLLLLVALSLEAAIRRYGQSSRVPRDVWGWTPWKGDTCRP